MPPLSFFHFFLARMGGDFYFSSQTCLLTAPPLTEYYATFSQASFCFHSIERRWTPSCWWSFDKWSPFPQKCLSFFFFFVSPKPSLPRCVKGPFQRFSNLFHAWLYRSCSQLSTPFFSNTMVFRHRIIQPFLRVIPSTPFLFFTLFEFFFFCFDPRFIPFPFSLFLSLKALFPDIIAPTSFSLFP